MQTIIWVFGRWKMSSYDWLLGEILCILFMIFITDITDSSSSVLMSSLWSSYLFVLISFSCSLKTIFCYETLPFKPATLVLPFSCPTHPGCSIIPVSSYHLHSHRLNSRGSFLFPIFFFIAYISSLLCCPVALIWCEFLPFTKQTFFYLFLPIGQKQFVPIVLTAHSLDFLKLFLWVCYATILKFWEIISQELNRTK